MWGGILWRLLHSLLPPRHPHTVWQVSAQLSLNMTLFSHACSLVTFYSSCVACLTVVINVLGILHLNSLFTVEFWGSLWAGCTLLARRLPQSGAATWRERCRLEREHPERWETATDHTGELLTSWSVMLYMWTSQRPTSDSSYIVFVFIHMLCSLSDFVCNGETSFKSDLATRAWVKGT